MVWTFYQTDSSTYEVVESFTSPYQLPSWILKTSSGNCQSSEDKCKLAMKLTISFSVKSKCVPKNKSSIYDNLWFC